MTPSAAEQAAEPGTEEATAPRTNRRGRRGGRRRRKTEAAGAERSQTPTSDESSKSRGNEGAVPNQSSETPQENVEAAAADSVPARAATLPNGRRIRSGRPRRPKPSEQAPQPADEPASADETDTSTLSPAKEVADAANVIFEPPPVSEKKPSLAGNDEDSEKPPQNRSEDSESDGNPKSLETEEKQ